MSSFELEKGTIGERIKEIRKEKKLTQEVLAKRMGFARNIVINIENGETDIGGRFLYEFQKLTGCSLDYLFTGKESIVENSSFLELLSLFKRLSPKNQEYILLLLREFPQ